MRHSQGNQLSWKCYRFHTKIVFLRLCFTVQRFLKTTCSGAECFGHGCCVPAFTSTLLCAAHSANFWPKDRRLPCCSYSMAGLDPSLISVEKLVPRAFGLQRWTACVAACRSAERSFPATDVVGNSWTCYHQCRQYVTSLW